jgi:hypothetical protein
MCLGVCACLFARVSKLGLGLGLKMRIKLKGKGKGIRGIRVRV